MELEVIPVHRLINTLQLARDAAGALVMGQEGDTLLADLKGMLRLLDRQYRMRWPVQVGWMPGLGFRPAVVALSYERMDETVAAYTRTSALGRKVARYS